MGLGRLLLVAALVIAGCGVRGEPQNDAAHAPSGPVRSSPPRAEASPAPRDLPPTVTRNVTGWWAWAMLDRRTGQITGSANRSSETNSTESMIKTWLAADYLAGVVRAGREPTRSEADTIRRALRVSDDSAAEWLYRARGGDAGIRRMIGTCDLTGTRSYPGRWALTQITAQDAARLGGCLAGGTALDPEWTSWLLHEMRSVAPSNAFGIREAFPPGEAAGIAVKNGWTPHWEDGRWHVNCLGVWGQWSLAVLARYPVALGLPYGAALCRDVARQLFG